MGAAAAAPDPKGKPPPEAGGLALLDGETAPPPNENPVPTAGPPVPWLAGLAPKLNPPEEPPEDSAGFELVAPKLNPVVAPVDPREVVPPGVLPKEKPAVLFGSAGVELPIAVLPKEKPGEADVPVAGLFDVPNEKPEDLGLLSPPVLAPKEKDMF